ncbi:MAG: hydroxymethylbilane synthase [Deltaproteobacteria bacterium]|nr:hydroxymethylbilane synthase [Deltaproteobacteria bacterium]
MTSRLTIGTRGSALALWQANHVADRLRAADPELEVELQVIKTKGDKILDVALSKVGGKGLFVKEIEEALMRKEIDLAVHSMKDVPAELVDGATLSAISEREDPRDALVSCGRYTLETLPEGATVGTSSLRRRTQLLAKRPDLAVADLRGNVDTRLRKCEEGQFAAVILAAAGLRRLGYADKIDQALDAEHWLPAVGQGALGIETRADDQDVLSRVAVLHDQQSADAVIAERALLLALDGGCQVPIAGYARCEGDSLRLSALVGHPSGEPTFRVEGTAPRSEAAELGRSLAQQLLAQGADRVLREVYGENAR